ncbi:hypothetical protein SD37_28150 [Amycolatopsis orientalis]|uniref:Uncharacterized protein n=2 Tax=Amycolatopsis orientalis TaxID=31958 RepID=A0A193C3U7_AMYOR|nr:hypothetical protein SD37_28150 [Amycolatopsis orientalis]
MALSGTGPLVLRVFVRTEPTPGKYQLTPASNPVFDFLAPHNPVGHRFKDVPKVASNGVVSATKVGVYLFQVRVGKQFLVGRLQVHTQLQNWWFGNDSITTALDVNVAHAQPSIYARFTPGEPVDEVGDITGHGYVQLVSQEPNKVAIGAEGRLRGLVATPDEPEAVTIDGTFPGLPGKSVGAFVVDYDRPRDVREIRISDTSNVGEMQNILFLSEGFRQADLAESGSYSAIVESVVKDMFKLRRHEPYGMLQQRFNVFSRGEGWLQNGVTTGFRVTNRKTSQDQGFPIPYNGPIHPDDRNKPIYPMDEFVARVGLPIPGDKHDKRYFLQLWASQSLHDFKPEKVSDKLFDGWKEHHSKGILFARDTFFGFQIGRRWADRLFDASAQAVDPPASDDVSDPKLKPFIARVYGFYRTSATRALSLDPRRHPPELYAGPRQENPQTSFMRYVRGLRYETAAIGDVWVPSEVFKRSRGLIAVIVNDPLSGGTNINAKTVAVQTVDASQGVFYEDARSNEDPGVMRRNLPPQISFVPGRVTDVVTHEFGHSFNLADEYEDAGSTNDAPDAGSAVEKSADNVTRLGVVRVGTTRAIDAAKVKWTALPRIEKSARLVKASVDDAGRGIKVFIDPRRIRDWSGFKGTADRVYLRKIAPTALGVQLPLGTSPAEYVPELSVVDVDPSNGGLTLKGATMPQPSQYAGFAAGSLLYVPMKRSGQALSVVREDVLAFLKTTKKPMNSDPNHVDANTGPDIPLPIGGVDPGFLPRGLLGVYEGADHWPGGNYRPAGECKMRDQSALGDSGQFCHVCKWLIVNRVDPAWHAWLEDRFYPGRRLLP